jgi:two-component system chemotaxis sensor kinase CheA
MALDDPELLAEFVTEAREHLSDVEGQFLEIEAGGGNVDVDLVNTVFRGIHSIKGAAGFLGLTTVNKLAHSLENVLGRMRNLELTPNA